MADGPKGGDYHEVPAELGDRGQQLWVDMGGSWEQDPGARLLLHEACRLADRMEILDRVLRGDGDTWMTFDLPRGDDEDQPLKLKIDGALAEARLHVTTLRQLLQNLRRVRPTGRLVPGKNDESPPPPPERNPVDELQRLRAARRSDAANS